MAKQEIIKLNELHYDIETAYKNDALKLLLNQPPHNNWIKKHPFAGNKYLPIDKVEFLLDRIFQEWKVEVLREGTLFNSVYCTIRLHYRNPATGEWSFHDGVGAKSCQLDSGSKASDMANIKQDAVSMALPTAKSMAIRDAADHLGTLFGRDLNRKDTVQFEGTYHEKETTPPDSKNNYSTASNDLPV